MSNFDAIVNRRGLADKVIAAKGAWGRFDENAAWLIQRVAAREKTSPVAIAITWLEETVFNFFIKPNFNHALDDPATGAPAEPSRWDYGPAQLNYFWTMKSVNAGEYALISEAEANAYGFPSSNYAVFGVSLWQPGANPRTPLLSFSGSPEANLRVMCRRLLSVRRSYDRLEPAELAIRLKAEHLPWQPDNTEDQQGCPAYTEDPAIQKDHVLLARAGSSIPTCTCGGMASIEELRVVRYTGKAHQAYRRGSYRDNGPLFDGFFAEYQP